MLHNENHNGIRVLTLDRAPLNALTLESLQAMSAALQEVAADKACKGMVITGANGVFTGGIDIRAIPTYSTEKRNETAIEISRMSELFYNLDMPVVAAINGHTIGAGMVMMLMCDYRVAATGDYRIGLTEAAAGIAFPAGPREIVRSELSPQLVRIFAIGADVYPPSHPYFGDLIDEHVDAEALIDTSFAAVHKLAAMPAFSDVKAQYRREARQRLAETDFSQDPVIR